MTLKLFKNLKDVEDVCVCVVDIRSEENYEEEHIDGSQNRPIREALLFGNIEEAIAELDDLPDDENLITVCDAGVASTETAWQLQDPGRDASALDGGLNAWKCNQG